MGYLVLGALSTIQVALAFVHCRLKVFVSVLLCVAAFQTVAWSQTMNRPPAVVQLDQLAQKAAGSDPESIRALVVGIFVIAGLQSDHVASIQDRIVAAELSYRNGQHDSIPQRNIVAVLNELAKTLNLPTYARTTAKQVGQIRSTLRVLAPHLSGFNLAKAPAAPNQMSPIEAAAVALVLIKQKIDNPAYQVEPSEWDRSHPGGASASPENAKHRPSLEQKIRSPRAQELITAFQQTTSAMSATELAVVTNKTLDDAGF